MQLLLLLSDDRCHISRCLLALHAEFAGFAQMLAAGIYGSHMAQAAELLAFAKPGWQFKARAQRMFLDVIHPACSLFCGRTSDTPPLPRPQTCDKGANGNWCVPPSPACLALSAPVCPAALRRCRNGLRVATHPLVAGLLSPDGLPPSPRPLCRAATNGLRVAAPRRDASCMSGVASWAVFLDNVTMLNTVLEYYKSGRGNGRLEHYIYASGQCQESGRDQGHTQLGIR